MNKKTLAILSSASLLLLIGLLTGIVIFSLQVNEKNAVSKAANKINSMSTSEFERNISLSYELMSGDNQFVNTASQIVTGYDDVINQKALLDFTTESEIDGAKSTFKSSAYLDGTDLYVKEGSSNYSKEWKTTNLASYIDEATIENYFTANIYGSIHNTGKIDKENYSYEGIETFKNIECYKYTFEGKENFEIITDSELADITKDFPGSTVTPIVYFWVNSKTGYPVAMTIETSVSSQQDSEIGTSEITYKSSETIFIKDLKSSYKVEEPSNIE